MNKKIRNIATLKIPCGEANSKPPLGSTIGQFGVPIMDFCNLFNKLTLENNYKKGILINCNLIIYSDFNFSIEIKNIDLGYFLKIALKNDILSNKKKLSTNRGRVQSLLYGIKKRNKRKKKKKLNFFFFSSFGLLEISKIKYNFININISLLSYYKSVYGTCRSMGIFVFPSFYMNNYEKIKHNFLLNILKNEKEFLLKKLLINKKIKFNTLNTLLNK
jgi:large subunit ribosomal protein L11